MFDYIVIILDSLINICIHLSNMKNGEAFFRGGEGGNKKIYEFNTSCSITFNILTQPSLELFKNPTGDMKITLFQLQKYVYIRLPFSRL